MSDDEKNEQERPTLPTGPTLGAYEEAGEKAKLAAAISSGRIPVLGIGGRPQLPPEESERVTKGLVEWVSNL